MAVTSPQVMPYARHVFHIYAVRTAERAVLQESLRARDIQTGIHYPTPVHLLPAFADLGYHRGQFPQAERAADEVLSLPMFAELTAAQCEAVSEAIRATATEPELGAITPGRPSVQVQEA